MTDAVESTTSRDERLGWKRNVTLFLVGQTALSFGFLIVDFAVVWHLMLTTESGTVMMWSAIFTGLPTAFVSLLGGVWADRHSRKLLIIGSNTAMALVSLSLAFAMLNGVHDTWLLFLALGIRSAFAGIQGPAVIAVLPQIVPADRLLRVNGINQSLQAVLFLLAPAAAGVIYAAAGIQSVFFIDVAAAVLGIALLAVVPIARVVAAASEGGVAGVFADIAGGVRYVVGHSSIRWLMLLLGVLLLLAGAPMLLTTLMVVRTFGGEVWMISGNEIAWGIGGLLGGLVVAALAPRLTNRILLIIGAVLSTGVMTILLGLSTNLWVFYAVGLLLAFGLAFETTPTTTILQETVEPEMQGRVFGFYSLVFSSAFPLSMIAFGPLADQFSVESLLIAAGILLLVFMLALLAIPAARRSLARISAA